MLCYLDVVMCCCGMLLLIVFSWLVLLFYCCLYVEWRMGLLVGWVYIVLLVMRGLEYLFWWWWCECVGWVDDVWVVVICLSGLLCCRCCWWLLLFFVWCWLVGRIYIFSVGLVCWGSGWWKYSGCWYGIGLMSGLFFYGLVFGWRWCVRCIGYSYSVISC